MPLTSGVGDPELWDRSLIPGVGTPEIWVTFDTWFRESTLNNEGWLKMAYYILMKQILVKTCINAAQFIYNRVLAKRGPRV